MLAKRYDHKAYIKELNKAKALNRVYYQQFKDIKERVDSQKHTEELWYASDSAQINRLQNSIKGLITMIDGLHNGHNGVDYGEDN